MRDRPLARTAIVRPPASTAALCATPSIPRPSPLGTSLDSLLVIPFDNRDVTGAA
jgi:hypothetical protein